MAVTSEEELRRAFDALDGDGSGEVTLREVRLALQTRLRGYGADGRVEAYMAKHDLNEDGVVSWAEFRAVLMPAVTPELSGEPESEPTPGQRVSDLRREDPDLAMRLLRRFQDLDLDGSGRLTYDEVAAAMRAEGREDTWPALRREMAKLDHSRDGKVSYAEFLSASLGFPATGEMNVEGIDVEI